MAVVEKYKKYAIEKKQVSYDRGVTWEDVTPSETRYGEEVGIFDTLQECEDTNCDLMKYEYYVADGILPDNICANVIDTIPYGIASSVTFTDGAVCCTTWGQAGAYLTDLFGQREPLSIGRPICGNGYCPTFAYSANVGTYGFEIELGYYPNSCVGAVSTCLRIEQFMPWAEGKSTWKMIYKQHYTREHCSEEWVADGPEELEGIGERWIRESEDYNNEYWRHQIASEFDESGNVVTWTDTELDIRQITSYQLPAEIEIIDQIRDDGIADVTAVTLVDRTSCITLAYPYKIPEDNGFQGDDAYYNAAEIGYILRDEYGSKVVLETIMGSYINTNSVRKPLIAKGTTQLITPSDAVSVTMNSRGKNIPSNSFKGHSTLTAITMVDDTYVGDSAFSGTSSLQTVTFGRNTTLGEYVFEDSNIRSVDLSNVTSMGRITFRNSSLESLTIGNSLTTIPQFAFENCYSLRGNIVIPSTITSIGNIAFQYCSGVTSFVLNEGLQSIGQFSFADCKSISEITIPSTVTSYGYSGAFKRCSKLEKVTINTTATITADTFVGCNIKELIITTTTPPLVRNGRAIWGGVFDFASEAVILVPASAVNTYKKNGGNEGWHNVASMIHPIPTETEWVNIGYACVDGQRYDYEHKRGRNTAYSNDWFWLPEYRTVGEPYGECDGTEPY